MLLALLLALTIDPVASESAATATTASAEVATVTTAERAVESTAEIPDVVSGFSRTVTSEVVSGFSQTVTNDGTGVPLVLTNVFQKKQEPARALR